jgi:hypothetical protein
MSKYALKLEQLVQTDAYGDILVTIQYDGGGPKIVAANGDGLSPDLKHTLDTYLGLVNFTLAKGVTPTELADQLEAEPQDGIHLPINDMLVVISSALREAPENVGSIKPEILMEIVPEMIAQITQSLGGTIPNQDEEPVQNPQSDEAPVNNNPQPQTQKPSEDEKQNQKSDDGDKDNKNSFFGSFNRN